MAAKKRKRTARARVASALKRYVRKATKKNPKRKSVRLKNFTGTVSRVRGGGVKITGRQSKRK